MAISLIATASSHQASGNISFAHGLTLLSGDVLIGTNNINGTGNTATDNNGATPFTKDREDANPDSGSFSIFSRYCGASEPSAYNFTLGSSDRSSIILRQYRGVDPSIWDVAPSASTLNSGFSGDSTCTAPSIAIATAGAAALVLMGDDRTPTTTTFSSVNNGFANAVSKSGQQYQATADKLGLAIGATGTTIITSSALVTYVIHQVALKPLGLSLDQEGARFRNDDGSESAASWLAAQDSNITRAQRINTRLRFLINATGDPASQRYKLRYRKVGDDGWRDLSS